MENLRINKKALARILVALLIFLYGYYFNNKNLKLKDNNASPAQVPSAEVLSESDKAPTDVPVTGKSEAKVIKVIDGDTIEIEGNIKVRLIGVDTPETVDPRRPVGCYGKEASDFVKSQLSEKTVELEKDVSETDKYGRLLRYVWLDGQLFNDTLVKEGYAQVSTYPPNVKYEELFLKSQARARSENKGLWGSCTLSKAPVPSQKAVITIKPAEPSDTKP